MKKVKKKFCLKTLQHLKFALSDIFNKILWNHNCSWETNVPSFVGNHCTRIFLPMNVHTSICLVFFFLQNRTYYLWYYVPTNRKICGYPHEPEKLWLPPNIDTHDLEWFHSKIYFFLPFLVWQPMWCFVAKYKRN